MRQKIENIIDRLARADIIFYLMPPLMALLLIGTLAQKTMGLYAAHKMFFASLVFWVGPLPLPGGYMLIALLSVFLSIKFIFKSDWQWKKSGIIITHLGALILLIGGFITALSSHESYIMLAEGQSSPYMYDYTQRSLSIYRDGEQYADIKTQHLEDHENIGLPFAVKLIKFCDHCEVKKREDFMQGFASDRLRDFAQFMALEGKAVAKDPEENLGGVTFEVRGLDDAQNGVYIAFENMPRAVDFEYNGSRYALIFGKQQRTLPFAITLKDFKKDSYPGTNKARAYSSQVMIIDGDVQWPAVIEMNAPLRYKGYTFYQSSFEKSEIGEVSILSVVKNRGRLLPYIGTIVIMLGLMLHIFLRLGRNFALVIAFCVCTPSLVQAQDMSAFSSMPVLHEGRVKPLDSFARLYLKKIHQKENVEGQSAIYWLADTIFNPALAIDQKIFVLRSNDLKTQLGLSHDARYFSLTDLQPGLTQTLPQIFNLLALDSNERTKDQNALLALHENVLAYQSLLNSFSLLMPLEIILPKKYGQRDIQTQTQARTYWSLLKLYPDMRKSLEALVQKKGNDLERFTQEERLLAQAVFRLNLVYDAAVKGDIVRVIPDDHSGELQTPWHVFTNEDLDTQSYRNAWSGLMTAWNSQDFEAWGDRTDALFSKASVGYSRAKLTIEVLYNVVKPFHCALALYIFAFLSLFISALRKSNLFYRVCLFTSSTAIVLHASGIIARMYILDRAPVGTLYESIVFVAFVCALCSLFISLVSKNKLIIFSGVFSAAGLLSIAPFLLAGGESMDMLVAVLNTNFWLATHVLCITIGYGTSIMASCFAHMYLGARLLKRSSSMIKALQMILYKTVIVALLFTAVGTALGGIWADQSWGRFWGWDPKENGALLIVLWLVWILHGRMSGHLRTLAFAAMASFLSVIVALAWFGVNLLSVGLHSYGFIDGIALALAIFCAVESFIILSLCGGVYYQQHRERLNNEG